MAPHTIVIVYLDDTMWSKSFITVSLDANFAISAFKHEPGLIAEPDSLLDPVSWLCYTISPLLDDVDVSEQHQNKVVWHAYHAHCLYRYPT